MPIKPIRGTRLNLAHPLAKGLVGCWLFNEGTGGRIFDLSMNGNHGTFVKMDNTSAWAGGGLLFDGVDDYIQISDISCGGNRPIAIFAKGSIYDLSVTGDVMSQSTEVALRLTSTNIEFILNSFTTNDRVSVAHDISINEEHTFAGVYDGTDLIVYIDGVEKGRVTPEGSYADIANDFDIGRLGNNSEFWNGSLDYVFLWVDTVPDIFVLNKNEYAMFEQTFSPAWFYVAPTLTGRISRYHNLNGLGGQGQMTWNPLG